MSNEGSTPPWPNRGPEQWQNHKVDRLVPQPAARHGSHGPVHRARQSTWRPLLSHHYRGSTDFNEALGSDAVTLAVSVGDGRGWSRFGTDQFHVAYATRNWSRLKSGVARKSTWPRRISSRGERSEIQAGMPVSCRAHVRSGPQKNRGLPSAADTLPYPSEMDAGWAGSGPTSFMSHMRHETGRDLENSFTRKSTGRA